MNRFAFELDRENMLLIPASLAFRAANENIAEKTASRSFRIHFLRIVRTAVAVLNENAPGLRPCARLRRAANNSESHQKRRGKPRESSVAYARAVIDQSSPLARSVPRRAAPDKPRCFSIARFSTPRQVCVEDVMHQRAFARTGNAGDARQHAEWKVDINSGDCVRGRLRLATIRAATGGVPEWGSIGDRSIRAVSVRWEDNASNAPLKTSSPPASPRPGPSSMRWSAARMTASSCSTTSRVLPLSRRVFITRSGGRYRAGAVQCSAHRGRKGIDEGAPRQVVRLTRSISPPLSVLVGRSRLRYARPTSSRKRNRKQPHRATSPRRCRGRDCRVAAQLPGACGVHRPASP